MDKFNITLNFFDVDKPPADMQENVCYIDRTTKKSYVYREGKILDVKTGEEYLNPTRRALADMSKLTEKMDKLLGKTKKEEAAKEEKKTEKKTTTKKASTTKSTTTKKAASTTKKETTTTKKTTTTAKKAPAKKTTKKAEAPSTFKMIGDIE